MGSGRICIPYFISLSSSKFKKAGTQSGHNNINNRNLFSHSSKEVAMFDSSYVTATKHIKWHGHSWLADAGSAAWSHWLHMLPQSWGVFVYHAGTHWVGGTDFVFSKASSAPCTLKGVWHTWLWLFLMRDIHRKWEINKAKTLFLNT